MICEICEKENPYWSWTDTHGVAQCMTCGTPYRIYHYEGEGESARRVEKEPTICLKTKFIPLLKKYWNDNHRIIPGGHSFPGGQELASNSDIMAFNEWMKQNNQ